MGGSWRSPPDRGNLTRLLLAHFGQSFVHQRRLQAQPGAAKSFDNRPRCPEDAAMAAENYDAQRADHRKTQTTCAATCRQIIQDDFRPRPLKSMRQNLGLTSSQVPEANPVGHRLILNLYDRRELFDPLGGAVAIGTRLDFVNYGIWNDEGFREGYQEIEALDPGEEDQR